MAEIITDACPNFNGSAHDNSHLPFVPEQLWGAHLHPLKKLGSFARKRNDETGKWEDKLKKNKDTGEWEKVPQEKVPSPYKENPHYVEISDEDRRAKLKAGEKVEPKGWGWGGLEPKLTKRDKRYGVCLTRSKLFVLDIDTHGVDGNETLREVLAKLDLELDTFTVATGTGGFHYYFQLPEELAADPITKATNLWPGVDVFPQDQQVVGPGTTRTLKDGTIGRYEVSNDAPISEVPAVLLQAIRDRANEVEAEEAARRKAEREEREAERQNLMADWRASGRTFEANNDELYPWEERKLQELCSELESLVSGDRNSPTVSLFAQAGTYFGFDKQHLVEHSLKEAALSNGMDPNEVDDIFTRFYESSATSHTPWTPDPDFYKKSPGEVASRTVSDELTETTYEVPYLTSDFFTDIGVARGFAEAKGHRYMAIREWREKTRSAFDEKRGVWGEINGEEVSTAIQEWITDEIFPELLKQSEKRLEKVEKRDGADSDAYKDQQKSEARLIARADKYRGKGPAHSAAQTFFGGHTKSSDIFDSNPDLLLTPSGVVDLRTGELRTAQPDDYFTKTAAVEYEPGFKSELWDEILTAFEPTTLEYLQVVIGQGLTGYQPADPSVYFFVGGGSNGKSTFLDTVVDLMGDYSETLDSDMLSGNDSFSRSGFKGVRLNLFEETGEGQHLDDKAVKKITGTDKMRGAQKFKDEETFKVITTNFITTNELPRITALDEGTWRRLKVFAMPNKYVRPENYDATTAPATTRLRNPKLNKANENPEILKAAMAWAVEGALKWYAAGKQEPAVPAVMLDIQREWRYQQDKVGYWWSEFIVADEGCFVVLNDLYETYKMSMKESGREPGSKQKFTAALEAHALFIEAEAEYKQRVKVPRSAGKLTLKHSTTKGPKNTHPLADAPENLSSPEEAAKARFWVQGLRFRTATDTDEEDTEQVSAAKPPVSNDSDWDDDDLFELSVEELAAEGIS